jgi:shikimate kinase
MKTIVLTGMSGSGKSTVGKILSEKTKKNFIDIDEQIVLNEKKSINEIFAHNGENYFRELEIQTIKNVFEPEDLIISLGGGTFENEQTRNFLLENSVVIYLKTSPEAVLERLKNANDRPLLNNNMNFERIEKLLNSRKNNYELAHFMVITDNKNIEEVASEILRCANLK